MRVLIYGGRDFGAPELFRSGSPEQARAAEENRAAHTFLRQLVVERFPRTAEDEYGNYLPDITILTGGATGADSIGEDFAVVNWTGYEGFPAKWREHGRAAGPIRNQEMLDSGVDLAIEFPGGSGTADMRRRLEKAGVPIIYFTMGR